MHVHWQMNRRALISSSAIDYAVCLSSCLISSDSVRLPATMKKYFALLVLFTSLCVTLSQLGIVGLPFEGTWNANGPIDDGGFSWFVEYRFEGDEYWKSGYPPISEHGIFELSGNTILFTSSNEMASMQDFKLAEDGHTLDISGLTFTYVKENP